MPTGREIRAARERAGLTQAELAQRVGVSMRTVGNWERGETIPMNRASAVEDALAEHLARFKAETPAEPLRTVSDAELLAEIARRFSRGATRSGWQSARVEPIEYHEDGEVFPREGIIVMPAKDEYGLVADDADGADHQDEDEERETEA